MNCSSAWKRSSSFLAIILRFVFISKKCLRHASWLNLIYLTVFCSISLWYNICFKVVVSMKQFLFSWWLYTTFHIYQSSSLWVRVGGSCVVCIEPWHTSHWYWTCTLYHCLCDSFLSIPIWIHAIFMALLIHTTCQDCSTCYMKILYFGHNLSCTCCWFLHNNVWYSTFHLWWLFQH